MQVAMNKYYDRPSTAWEQKLNAEEARKKAQQQKFFANMSKNADGKIDDAFLYSTSDLNYNLINQMHKADSTTTNKKKGKGKMQVVCNTELTEEQLNEKIEIDISENLPQKNKKKKGEDTQKWNKLQVAKEEKNAGGDLEDFKYFDEPAKKNIINDEDFAPLMMLAEPKKKEDDSRQIMRGAGKKKNKGKDKGVPLNTNAVPTKEVDYNKLYNFK